MTTQKKAILAVYVISFVLLFAGLTGTTIAYIINSYVPAGYSPGAIQQLMSMPAIFGLVTSFVIGPVAIKINKKYLTMLCAVMVFLYFVIFAAVGSNGPFPLLLAATAFGGIAQGSAMTLMSSMIGEFAGPAKSANYVAIGLAIMNAGGALVALAGGAIAVGNGGAAWPQAYYLGVLVIPALIIFGILMPKKPDDADAVPAAGPAEGTPPPPPAGGKLPVRNVIIGILAVFSSICICGFLFYISVYIVNEFKLGTSVEAGIANSIFTITGVVTGFTYGIWAKLFRKFLIVVSFGLVTLALFCMMTFTSTLLGAYLGALLMSFGFNMMNPFIMGFIIRITPARLVPVGISCLMAGANMGMFAAIYVLDFLSGLLGGGLGNVLLVATAGMAICTAAAWFVYQEPKAGHSTAA
ncbi:MAG: MFS transporter [Spirochaetaceae bacterium]|jgi:MFS family permease|nr:MFS transporter [Spirochaetaceae bacterium]